MFETYHYEFPLANGKLYVSSEFQFIEECVQECKSACAAYNINYYDRDVKLFFTNDNGETYEECTEEGELAG